jgi:anti-sigma regulatory factor (Ser/Thr protein kinase)
MDKPFTSYHIEERSFVAYVKREIHSMVARAKFSSIQAGEIDIIVSEIASNLIKHAGKGELLYRILSTESESTFEIISIDKGPGMSDTARMMKDGVSTTRTLGQGLGAIHRLSTTAQLFSMPGWGTILYSLVRSDNERRGAHEKPTDLDIRALCVNKPREDVCGDGYRIKRSESEMLVFFADGLGHGPHAKEAVDRAGEFFQACQDIEPVDIIRQMHENIRRTRGLVGTVAFFNKKSAQWKICGVGNVLTRMYTGITYKNYLPYNGTIGLNLPNSMNPSVFNIERNQHLIMCSDGIQTRWDLNKYPSIFKYDNTVLAAAVYKDFNRANDDSSILIAKVV